ncbi:MAG: hypothetical protein ACJA1J_003759 [Sulfitobacter pontiacus]|jgi:hypothetical protein
MSAAAFNFKRRRQWKGGGLAKKHLGDVTMKFGKLMIAAALATSSAPVFAATSAETDCQYQADVVQAVRQARIDRVKERDVPDHIASKNPEWPDRYDAVVPLVAPWVYEMKMRDVKGNDLSAAWNEMCLGQ